MIFDIKDVKSWATRHDVKVGDEGYFADSIDAFRNSDKKYIGLTRGKIGGVLDDSSTCFQIENSRGSFGTYAFFIPLDKVKEENKYRPFKDTYEFYKFLINPSIQRKNFRNSMMLNLFITYREIKSPQYTTMELITRVTFNETDKACKSFINKRDFEEWFDHYEILNAEDKWQPFGAVENTGE